MQKYAYYSPMDDSCHYLYMDGEGNAAYERYSINEEMLTDHLDNLSDEQKEEWLLKAYDAEEQMFESEEQFLDEFIKYFDLDGDVKEEEEDTAESRSVMDEFDIQREDGEFFGYRELDDKESAEMLEEQAQKLPEITETVMYEEDGKWHVGVKGPVH